MQLITPAEATDLLMRPTRGRKVHTSSILRWGKAGNYQIQWCNGWKVDRVSFEAWARRVNKLPGSGRIDVRPRLRRLRDRQQSSEIYLERMLGIRVGGGR